MKYTRTLTCQLLLLRQFTEPSALSSRGHDHLIVPVFRSQKWQNSDTFIRLNLQI